MMELVVGFACYLALLAQIVLGVWLFSSRLPRRGNNGLASALVVAVYFAVLILLNSNPLSITIDESFSIQFVTFSLFLAVCVGLVLCRHEVTLPTALFCAAAGYTTQNLASGLDGLVKLLALTWHGIPEYDMRLWIPSFVLCTTIVYVPVYLLFVRRVRAMALDRTEHRSMLGIIFLVVLEVILFDVMNKMLPGFGTPLPVVVCLRIIHGTTCAFVLYAQYQMLFGRRMQLDKAATELLLDERGRQYEISREAIASVNRRVHDIRHQVARQLDAAQVDRTTLAEVVRAVDVYDSALNTGNEALDTVLMEKGMACKRESIGLTCIADGTALTNLSPADAYALVSELLDVAMAAVGAQNEERRTISLVIRSVSDMASVHVECFTDAKVEGDAVIERIAAAYGGWFTHETEDGILSLDAMIPLG